MKVSFSNWKSCGTCLRYSNRSFVEVRCISFWGLFLWAIDLMPLLRLYFQSRSIILNVLFPFGQKDIIFSVKCKKFMLALWFGCCFFSSQVQVFVFLHYMEQALCLWMSLDVSPCVCHIVIWGMWIYVHVCVWACMCSCSQRCKEELKFNSICIPTLLCTVFV